MKIKIPKENTTKLDICSILLSFLQLATLNLKSDENFEENYRKRLKLPSINDWKKFRACIDLIEDTEYAIINAFAFQLGAESNPALGEYHLRLYGITNAVSLQIQAIFELAKLLNFHKPKTIKDELTNLEIYKLRNITGAHTINWENEINHISSFRIVYTSISHTGNQITAIDEKNNSLCFDLIPLLDNFQNVSINILHTLTHFGITNLIKKPVLSLQKQNELNTIVCKMVDYKMLNTKK